MRTLLCIFVTLVSACGHADLIKERDSLLKALLITQRWERERTKEFDGCKERMRRMCSLYENNIYAPNAVRKTQWDRKKWRKEHHEYCYRNELPQYQK